MRDIGPRIACHHHILRIGRGKVAAQYTIVRVLADEPRRFLLVPRDLPHIAPFRVHRCDRGGALHDGLVTADERQKIADAHDAEIAPFGATQCGLVQRREIRTATRLAQDARVQQVGAHHVMDEGCT